MCVSLVKKAMVFWDGTWYNSKCCAPWHMNEGKVDGLLPFGVAVNDQIERVARLRHQRDKLLTAAIRIVGVVRTGRWAQGLSS